MTTELVAGLLAFVGGGLGSGLAFWATRNATEVDRVERRREEWGRRFTSALDALTSTDNQRAATGRALVRELMRSELATADDRSAATAVLDADATHDPTGTELRSIVAPEELDDTRIVQDTETNEPREGGDS
jgi:hypothetical protein